MKRLMRYLIHWIDDSGFEFLPSPKVEKEQYYMYQRMNLPRRLSLQDLLDPFCFLYYGLPFSNVLELRGKKGNYDWKQLQR